MPIFQYTCEQCEIDSDRVINYHDSFAQYCTKCNSKMFRHFPKPSLMRMGDSCYDTSRDVIDGMAGKPYKGKYFKEDEDSNMG